MIEFPKAAQTVDPYTLSNDSFGYSCYAVIIYATPEQQALVQEIRDAVRVRRSMLPAHVTVKGPICEIPSIDEVQRAIGKVAESSGPIDVKLKGGPAARRFSSGEVAALQPIRTTDDLAEVHRKLLEAINPIATNAYSLDATGEYHPHLTIYHEPEPEFEERGSELLEGLDIGSSFTAESLHLAAHSGTPFRGEWESLSEHRLTG